MAYAVDDSKLQQAVKDAQTRQTKSESGNGSNVKFFKFSGNQARLRIMPPWTGEGHFAGQYWRIVEQHWGVSDDNKAPILCPKNTQFLGGDCPICDFVNELRAQKDDPAAQELAKSLRSKQSYMFTVIDLDSPEYTAKDVSEWKQAKPDKKVPFEVGDPKLQVYAAPFTVYNSIIALGGSVVNLQAGHNITITRAGKNPQVKYTVTPELKVTSSAVSPDAEMLDLEKVGFVMSVEKMTELLAGGIGGDYFANLPSGGSSKSLPANTKSSTKTTTKAKVEEDDNEKPNLGGTLDDDEDLEAAMMSGLKD